MTKPPVRPVATAKPVSSPLSRRAKAKSASRAAPKPGARAVTLVKRPASAPRRRGPRVHWQQSCQLKPSQVKPVEPLRRTRQGRRRGWRCTPRPARANTSPLSIKLFSPAAVEVTSLLGNHPAA
jgi:hypothetical protein